MDLFIESPQRMMECASAKQAIVDASANEVSSKQLASNAAANNAANKRLDVPAADAYVAERAYRRHRSARRKIKRALRALLLLILIPIAIVAVFIISYAMTYILNGANLDEVIAALLGLGTTVSNFAQQVIAAVME